MNLLEITYPAGALDADDQAALASEVIAGLVGAADEESATVPEETLSRARKMTHIGFRGLDGWTTGDGPWEPETAPPLWITMTVPDAWRDDMARHVLGWLRRAVRRVDNDRGWQRSGGDLWINVVGIADGCIGLNGKPATADDVVAYMTEEFRAKLDAGTADVPDGVVVDPICQMHVKLGPDAITLDHDGVTMGFCAKACRASYAKEHGLTITAA